MSEKPLVLGQRVKVVGKDVRGAVAYVGYPTFASGKWVGVILDEPRGKNNGTIRGHAYFTCNENCGMFVRQTQLQLLDEYDNPIEATPTTPEDVKGSRSRLSSSRTSLAGSRQSLSGSLLQGSPTVDTPDSSIKRASFVETGFVSTLNPQFTPGQSITSPVALQLSPPSPATPSGPTAEERLALLQSQQEVEKLNNQVEDLTEKLDTLKARRMEDREKIKELERVRLQLDQANEFKARIMESQAQLQRDLQRAKQELRESQEAMASRADETAELAEACEMAALDREMAEERAETLQLELDSARERLEEAQLDMQLMRAEIDAAGGIRSKGDGAPPVAGAYELKQLEQQNARLRDTLVRLRDLSAHDKHHMQKIQKDLDQKRSEIAELSRTKEKLSTRVEQLEGHIADLQEQVDAALGAEEMVEQLGEKKMSLEDEVVRLKEEVSELEALQEVHEQLVESNRELELDLREELELAHAATREALREREAGFETIVDRDNTIQKFRELVQKLGEQCYDLRKRIDEKDNRELSTEPVSVDFRQLVASSKASTRAVDLELRALALRQAKRRADMLENCLPEHFTQAGGDNDAVLLLLLFERLSCKTDIILGQIRERFPNITGPIDRETLSKSHAPIQYSFRCALQFSLHMLQSTFNQWSYGLSVCSPDLLLKAASALPDAATQERQLDGLLDLLRTATLDENSNVEGIEKCFLYFAALRSAILSSAPSDECTYLRDICLAVGAAADAVANDAAIVCALAAESQLVKGVREEADLLQQQLKMMRRRLPTDQSFTKIGVDPDVLERLWTVGARAASRAVRTSHSAAVAASQATSSSPDTPITHQTDTDSWLTVKEMLSELTSEASTLVTFTQEHEYNMFDNLQVKDTQKPTPPIILRAQLVKKQLAETKTLTLKLENKDADLRELKKALKAKQDEVSEMQIRKELAERKLNSTNRDAELNVEKLTRKYEDAQIQLKRKEKEFEETMDHLQHDIDSLESERGALRDKLKMYAKRGGSTTPSGTPHGPATPLRGTQESPLSSLTSVKDVYLPSGDLNESLQREVKVLSLAVENERRRRVDTEAARNRSTLRRLRPLHEARLASDNNKIAAGLKAKLDAFQFEWTMHVAKAGLCKFPNDLSLYDKVLKDHKSKHRTIRKQLLERLSEIQMEIREELLRRKPWRCVDADFAKFPTPELTESVLAPEVATLTFPSCSPQDVTIFVTASQLKALRETVEAFSRQDVDLRFSDEFKEGFANAAA